MSNYFILGNSSLGKDAGVETTIRSVVCGFPQLNSALRWRKKMLQEDALDKLFKGKAINSMLMVPSCIYISCQLKKLWLLW